MSAAVSRCIGSAPDSASTSTGPATSPAPSSSASRIARSARAAASLRRHGAQAGQVEGQRAHRRRRQRRDRHRRPRADDPFAQVDQAHPGRQRATELVGDGSPVGADLVDQTGQPCGRSVIAEQVGADPVGHPQPAGEERTLGLLDHDQPSADQRPTQLQPGSGARRHGRLAGQLQGQPDRRAAPGHVVVEISVQALEPAVQIRQQRDHQQLDVQRSQTGGPGESPQPQGRSGCLGRVGVGLELDPGVAVQGVDGRHVRGEQLLDRLLAHVQASERVVRRRVTGAAQRHQLPHPSLDELGPAEEVGEVGCAHGRRPGCRVMASSWSAGSG